MAAGGATPATTTTPTNKVTFGVEPATAAGSTPRSQFSFGVTQGATVSDTVAVLNYSTSPLELDLQATDAIETPHGGFSLLANNKVPTGAGSWMTLPASAASVVVPAESATAPGSVLVPFQVHVPRDASPGDHVGGIVASLTTTGGSSGRRIVLVQRVGVRVFLHVAGTVHPAIALDQLSAHYSGSLNPLSAGRVHVSYVIKNTGDIDLGIHQVVSLSGPIADDRHVALAPIQILLPGSSVKESANLTGVRPEGLLRATVTAQLKAPPDEGVGALPAVSASTTVLAVSWVGGALIVVLLAGLLLLPLFKGSSLLSLARARLGRRKRK
jgi:hypothetical protein